MKDSLYDILTDESGQLDFKRNHGTSKSKNENAFITELTKHSEKNGNSIFTFQELLTFSNQNNFNFENFENFIDKLNNNGYLIKKGYKTFKLTTS
jgi:DNA helicase MCM8